MSLTEQQEKLLDDFFELAEDYKSHPIDLCRYLKEVDFSELPQKGLFWFAYLVWLVFSEKMPRMCSSYINKIKEFADEKTLGQIKEFTEC